MRTQLRSSKGEMCKRLASLGIIVAWAATVLGASDTTARNSVIKIVAQIHRADILIPQIQAAKTNASAVVTTNMVTTTKERVLRVESFIPAPPTEVWKAFATEEGLKKWIAPVVALDLRTGGTLSTQYDKNARIGSPGTIRLGIVAYLENELIIYKVNLTEAFSPKVRAEDQNLQEIIQLVAWTNGTTKVVSSMVGWGTGPEWDQAYNFFAKGNTWSYQQLVKSFPKKEK